MNLGPKILVWHCNSSRIEAIKLPKDFSCVAVKWHGGKAKSHTSPTSLLQNTRKKKTTSRQNAFITAFLFFLHSTLLYSFTPPHYTPTDRQWDHVGKFVTSRHGFRHRLGRLGWSKMAMRREQTNYIFWVCPPRARRRSAEMSSTPSISTFGFRRVADSEVWGTGRVHLLYNHLARSGRSGTEDDGCGLPGSMVRMPPASCCEVALRCL